jgi:hypothetical protein
VLVLALALVAGACGARTETAAAPARPPAGPWQPVPDLDLGAGRRDPRLRTIIGTKAVETRGVAVPGRALAFTAAGVMGVSCDERPAVSTVVFDLAARRWQPLAADDSSGRRAWAGDGRRIAVADSPCVGRVSDRPDPTAYEPHQLDPDTGARTPVAGPGQTFISFSSDLVWTDAGLVAVEPAAQPRSAPGGTPRPLGAAPSS